MNAYSLNLGVTIVWHQNWLGWAGAWGLVLLWCAIMWVKFSNYQFVMTCNVLGLSPIYRIRTLGK